MSQDEFKSLHLHCPPSLKGIVLIGFYLPMRQAEILNLTWKEIDLKMGFIRLGGERTKKKLVGISHYIHELLNSYVPALGLLMGGMCLVKAEDLIGKHITKLLNLLELRTSISMI